MRVASLEGFRVQSTSVGMAWPRAMPARASASPPPKVGRSRAEAPPCRSIDYRPDPADRRRRAPGAPSRRREPRTAGDAAGRPGPRDHGDRDEQGGTCDPQRPTGDDGPRELGPPWLACEEDRVIAGDDVDQPEHELHHRGAAVEVGDARARPDPGGPRGSADGRPAARHRVDGAQERSATGGTLALSTGRPRQGRSSSTGCRSTAAWRLTSGRRAGAPDAVSGARSCSMARDSGTGPRVARSKCRASPYPPRSCWKKSLRSRLATCVKYSSWSL